MSKRTLCKGVLVLADKRADHLPVGSYDVVVQETWVQDGTLKFRGAVIGQKPNIVELDIFSISDFTTTPGGIDPVAIERPLQDQQEGGQKNDPA